MKQYLLFTGSDFYPEGGWRDFYDSYDSLEEAEVVGQNLMRRQTWWHVIDGYEGRLISMGR